MNGILAVFVNGLRKFNSEMLSPSFGIRMLPGLAY